jgi:hypothetical protein
MGWWWMTLRPVCEILIAIKYHQVYLSDIFKLTLQDFVYSLQNIQVPVCWIISSYTQKYFSQIIFWNCARENFTHFYSHLYIHLPASLSPPTIFWDLLFIFHFHVFKGFFCLNIAHYAIPNNPECSFRAHKLVKISFQTKSLNFQKSTIAFVIPKASFTTHQIKIMALCH